MAVPVTHRRGRPDRDTVESLELDLLLEAVSRHHGYDFRDYARTSIRRRVHATMEREGLKTISALQDRVLHDAGVWERFLQGISVSVSTMFRDPHFFLAIRQHLVPVLRTYPFIRIWQAGCSLGEEAYSLAILLQEEGLYERSLIYATDINEATLRQAREGIFPADQMQKFTQNYILAGGQRSFSEYYTARYEFALMRPSLQQNIVFSQHNLVSDGAFNEFNVILCRNVMIYFNRALQERTHTLFHSSLSMFGTLGLGSRESLRFLPQERYYQPIVPSEKLYRKVA
ncbi:MAG TPA: protein-glutamate O-methyltransferase CheR [Vicinamibacterales bacterium]